MDWQEKSILITGACGTIGRQLISALLNKNAKRIIALDHAESHIYHLDQEYIEEPRVHAVVGDVRNRDSIITNMQDIDIVFHGAALKHVNLGERTPDEIVSTNIIGVQNIIFAARKAEVERAIFMSSDKAVNPTNVMGTSKLMGERLISAANNQKAEQPIFSSTRFGNVLGSSGSAIPTFLKQMEENKPVTLTDERMSRFVMTSDEAISLLIKAAESAQGGEVFVTKMPVMRIKDMITATINLYAPILGKKPENITLKTIGKRPGEKFYEELLSSEETSRVIETEDFFIVHPAIRKQQKPSPIWTQGVDEYRSDNQPYLSVSKIEDYFATHGLVAASGAEEKLSVSN